jgi:uncharacterized protein
VSDDPVVLKEFRRSISNASQHLIILPTEKCNFRCTYCYEDFTIGRMSDVTVASTEAFLERRIKAIDSLSIEWFGGEPLLARDIIWRIASKVMGVIASADHAVAYRAGITTNGWYLDVPTAHRLVEHGVVRAQVSLDGPEDLHDATRRRIHGEGSFKRIQTNLEAIAASSVPIDVLLRIHLTPENAPVMEGFVAGLSKRYLSDPRFSLLLTPVGHLGGPNDDRFEILGESEAALLISRLAGVYGERAVRAKADRVDIMEAAAGPDVCYAAKMNSLVIRADGRLAKCTVALSNPTNDIGRLNRDGSLTLVDDRLRPWMRGWFNDDRAALSCPYENIPELKASGKKLLPLAVR